MFSSNVLLNNQVVQEFESTSTRLQQIMKDYSTGFGGINGAQSEAVTMMKSVMATEVGDRMRHIITVFGSLGTGLQQANQQTDLANQVGSEGVQNFRRGIA